MVFSKRRKVPRPSAPGAGEPFAFTKGHVSSRMRFSHTKYDPNQLDWSCTMQVNFGIHYGYIPTKGKVEPKIEEFNESITRGS